MMSALINFDNIIHKVWNNDNLYIIVTLFKRSMLGYQSVYIFTNYVCVKILKKRAHLKVHIESNHMKAGSHPCKECGKISKTRDALSVHYRTRHK